LALCGRWSRRSADFVMRIAECHGIIEAFENYLCKLKDNVLKYIHDSDENIFLIQSVRAISN
jgi:hypothetical protein